jgi:hypothetical protein
MYTHAYAYITGREILPAVENGVREVEPDSFASTQDLERLLRGGDGMCARFMCQRMYVSLYIYIYVCVCVHARMHEIHVCICVCVCTFGPKFWVQVKMTDLRAHT